MRLSWAELLGRIFRSSLVLQHGTLGMRSDACICEVQVGICSFLWFQL